MSATATPTELLMPMLAEGMEFGTVLAWLTAPGGAVARGDDLVEIETDKATMTWQAPAAGFLRQLADVGDTVAVGAPIGVLHATAAEALAEHRGAAAESTPAPADGAATPPPSAPALRQEGILASPLARRMARDRSLKLARITGSGRGGRILAADVQAAAHAAISAPPGAAGALRGEPRRTPLTRSQLLIAERMVQSKSAIPDFAICTEVDLEAAFALREQLSGASQHRPSINDIIVKAVGLALAGHLSINSSHRDGVLEVYPRVNVGFAVAAPTGLLVPTLFDADRRSLKELAAEARELAELARRGAIAPAQLQGGTFTVSNLGMHGMTRIFPIIHAGQAAILGVGAAMQRLVPLKGAAVVRRIAELTLTGDHRIINGAEAAAFLGEVRDLLQSPARVFA